MRIWTKEEAALLRHDLENMLFPEMVPDLIHSLGCTLPEDDSNMLNQLAKAEFRGFKVLELLSSSCNTVQAKSDHPEELDFIQQHLSQLKAQITDLSQGPITRAQISELIELTFWAGYHAGAHDTRTILQRHHHNGFQQSTIHSRAAGRSSAERYHAVDTLITSIASYIQARQDSIGKITRKRLTAAIHELLQEFAAINDHKQLPALQQYLNRCPSYDTIEKRLKAHQWQPSIEGKPVSLDKIKQEISAAFSHETIRSLLIKTIA
ncbi:hypothetical protein [Ferrimonas senticii]|uniref:hypothetical protein n=1 Tax=Ferrimonas senticii TaxID=394566 RepID=UPI0003F5A695|nr:hypothetical protein [Ferrimonas senticii]